VEGQANGSRSKQLGEPAREREQTPPLNQAQNAGPQPSGSFRPGVSCRDARFASQQKLTEPTP
jgi:hypothetical protein